MAEKVKSAQYVDIFDCLQIEDYYRTDTHWKQENIFPVAERLAKAMGMTEYLTSKEDYEENSRSGFAGVYWGQAALPVDTDTLTYLTSDHTENAKVTSLEFAGEKPVYNLDKLGEMDDYDLFLSGAQALLTVECPNAKTDRELIIFRDSFGSSLAPLFTGAYSKITLIDLRYIASGLLGDYVEFSDQDVLFLYSTSLLNSSMLLK